MPIGLVEVSCVECSKVTALRTPALVVVQFSYCVKTALKSPVEQLFVDASQCPTKVAKILRFFFYIEILIIYPPQETAKIHTSEVKLITS